MNFEMSKIAKNNKQLNPNTNKPAIFEHAQKLHGIFDKVKTLSNAGSYDSCGPNMCEVKVEQGLSGIYHSKAKHKTCKIFKTLMTNTCIHDCKYCGNAKGCNKKAESFTPSELANTFNYLHKNHELTGLFLSSGIQKDADYSTQKMIEAVSLVRRHGYQGYIHFKVLPGTSYELIKQASELSNRMSINIEAPNSSTLKELSTNKDYKIDILRRQTWIKNMNLSSGQTTQLILNELSTDKDVLKMMDWEYENINLKRMYFSSFKPIKGTPFENHKEESMIRQNHLYNVDFLVREYGFKIKEFDEIMIDGLLPKNVDPKLAIARKTFDKPVDINEAEYDELLRIPGIGPTTAKIIFQKKEKITRFEELRNLGVRVDVARPFIELDGKRQATLMDY